MIELLPGVKLEDKTGLVYKNGALLGHISCVQDPAIRKAWAEWLEKEK